MHIVWDGWIWDYNSFAIVNRNIACALHRIGADVRLNAWVDGVASPTRFIDYDLLVSLADRDLDIEHAVHIRQSWPVMAPYYNPMHDWKTMRGKVRVGFFIWECEHMPSAWFEPSQHVDKIIAISHFSAQRVERELRTYGVETPVLTIPLGVDRRIFLPTAPPAHLNACAYRFLYVGEWQPRKGSDLLLNAYVEEFSESENVSLVICGRGAQPWFDAIPANSPHILVVGNEILETEMGGIYSACQCLVHPARLEGFGMTMLEAMACGIPVICPDVGGQRAFATPENAVLIPSTEEMFTFPFELKGIAYRADHTSLKRAMRQMFEEGARPMQIDCGLKTAEAFSWERCAQTILDAVSTS